MNHWLQLSPYGTFPHSEGQQTISIDDAERFVRKTKTIRFLLRLKKIPVYLGHPDDPFFQTQTGHCNLEVYGYVRRIRTDQDGISVQIKWTKTGHRFLQKNCGYYLSTRWVLSKTKEQNTYHPETLLSVGLTQHPNLPVRPIDPSLFLPFWKRIWKRLQKWLSSTLSSVFSEKPKETPSQNYTQNLPEALPFPPQTTPLSSDLHSTQTRKEKYRILNFGKQVQERMRITGESYPEAWHALRQEKNLPSSSEPAPILEEWKKTPKPKRMGQPKPTKRNRSVLPSRSKTTQRTSCKKETIPSVSEEGTPPLPNENFSD